MTEPPKRPDPGAGPRALAKFERDQSAYTHYLLGKQGLTNVEQAFLARELAAWARENRR